MSKQNWNKTTSIDKQEDKKRRKKAILDSELTLNHDLDDKYKRKII